jgi:lactate dehydrogenase-like 2-hydroxyacid dehydrogenase
MGPALDVCLAEYVKDFDVQIIEDTEKPTAGDQRVAAEVTAVISYAVQRPHRLELFPKLRFIASFGAGYDKIDLASAAKRGIVVTNTPGATDNCVADMAMTLVLATTRRLLAGDRYVRSGDWQSKGMFPLTRSATGRRLGILGLGRIGSAIAKRALGFNMMIGYHSRRKVEGAPYTYYASPGELAAASDILVVSTSGGPATARLVDAQVIAALGPSGVLINVSRGSVVDEVALIDALQSGRLAAAGLDVFEREPLDPASPLTSMENVTLMPHRGSASLETFAAMARMVVANLHTHFEGRAPLNPIPMPAV